MSSYFTLAFFTIAHNNNSFSFYWKYFFWIFVLFFERKVKMNIKRKVSNKNFWLSNWGQKIKLSSVIPSEFHPSPSLVFWYVKKRKKKKNSNYFDVYHEQQQQSLQMWIQNENWKEKGRFYIKIKMLPSKTHTFWLLHLFFEMINELFILLADQRWWIKKRETWKGICSERLRRKIPQPGKCPLSKVFN